MKKWVFAVVVLLILALAAIYILIPNKQEVAKTAYFKTGSDLIHRQLAQQKNWQRWWPGTIDTTDKAHPRYILGNAVYSLTHHLFDAVEVQIALASDTIRSTILVVSLKPDSTALHWRGAMETGRNPFDKLRQYSEAGDIRKQMDKVFNSLKTFLQDSQYLYDIAIERNTVKDTLLISTKTDLDHYPSTSEIYELVNQLKQHISEKQVKQTNYPMLNIARLERSQFRVMVAIPINKPLPDNYPFAFKRMVPGNILVTTVNGGRYSIEKAFAEMELYIKENKLTPPAIPFESMITDRSKEPDTTKWITRIYYPIL